MGKKTSPEDVAKHLSRFLGIYLPHDRNVSPNTIASYRDTFVSFLTYLKENKGIKAEKITFEVLNRDNVVDYLRWLVEERRISISTRNNRLAAIRSFVSYLQYECVDHLDEWQRILAIRNMKKPHSVPKHFSTEGIRELLNQPDADNAGELRHLAILSLMYDSGCRVQELADITVGALQIQAAPFTVAIYGKGRKVRTVPISKNVAEIIRKYMHAFKIEELGTRSNAPLFFNHANEKLTRAGITYILKKYADMARVKCPSGIPESVSCHQLRHSRAMHLMQSGINLVWIRDILGHATIQTTEIYARTDSNQRREAIEKASECLTPKDVKGDWEDNKDVISWLKTFNR